MKRVGDHRVAVGDVRAPRELELELGREPLVVVVQQRDPGTAGRGDARRRGPAEADRLGQRDEPHGLRVDPAHLAHGGVVGAVHDDDDLEGGTL